MIRGQDYEDILDIHACESFGCGKLEYGFRTGVLGYAGAGSQMRRAIRQLIPH